MDLVVRRYEVWLITLDPSVGNEMQKTRPCVVVSPDELNRRVHTVIIAPITSTIKHYRFRVTSSFGNRKGEIAIDHLRSIDKTRLVKKMGNIDDITVTALTEKLQTMFAR